MGKVWHGLCHVSTPFSTTNQDGPYELASHCFETNSNILILLNNWLHSSQPQAESDDGQNDWNTLEYWATRLRPLWARDSPSSLASSDEVGEPNERHETIVIACNRSGTENGVKFAGTSAIFSMVRDCGRPKLLDMMGKDEEGVRVWNVMV
ncbi:hypothetical protein MD484_g6578, partial [Candolleomyces efflorescens]